MTRFVSAVELFEVEQGTAVCYIIDGLNVSVRMGLRNPSSSLMDVSAVVYGDKPTGMPFFRRRSGNC